jgi:hypothetical protein
MMVMIGGTTVLGSWWLIGHLPAQLERIVWALIFDAVEGCIDLGHDSNDDWGGGGLVTQCHPIVLDSAKDGCSAPGGLMLPLFFYPGWLAIDSLANAISRCVAFGWGGGNGADPVGLVADFGDSVVLVNRRIFP